MADYTISAAQTGAYEIALATNTVVTVALGGSFSQVLVMAHSGAPFVYAKAGTTVAVKDPTAVIIPTGTSSTIPAPGDMNTIALIANAASTVSVARA